MVAKTPIVPPLLSKMNKAVQEVYTFERRDVTIKEMMGEGRWQSASCGLKTIQPKQTEEEIQRDSEAF